MKDTSQMKAGRGVRRGLRVYLLNMF